MARQKKKASTNNQGKKMDERGNVLLWIGKNGKDCGQIRITYYIQIDLNADRKRTQHSLISLGVASITLFSGNQLLTEVPTGRPYSQPGRHEC